MRTMSGTRVSSATALERHTASSRVGTYWCQATPTCGNVIITGVSLFHKGMPQRTQTAHTHAIGCYNCVEHHTVAPGALRCGARVGAYAATPRQQWRTCGNEIKSGVILFHKEIPPCTQTAHTRSIGFKIYIEHHAVDFIL